MVKKLIVKDLLGAWILLTACILGGVIVNELRPLPLPLVYSPPQVRLRDAVGRLEGASGFPIPTKGEVSLDEMKRISATRGAVILDARPEIFYRLGHIPSALSLPRDDFEKTYHALEPLLQSYRDTVMIVYCAGQECEDSQMVGDALASLGYPHVRLFRGGWSDWEGGDLPEERE
jgi:rhodanese-related sulfurtransferase